MISLTRLLVGSCICATLVGCGGGSGSLGSGSLGGSANPGSSAGSAGSRTNAEVAAEVKREEEARETIFDLFDTPDPDTDYRVNRYIWNAALDVMSFLPIESADPFAGIIQYGFGRPPGGSQAYRATIRVTQAALEGRALRVDLRTASGPVSREVKRQIEDAILTRARQLRIQDGNL